MSGICASSPDQTNLLNSELRALMSVPSDDNMGNTGYKDYGTYETWQMTANTSFSEFTVNGRQVTKSFFLLSLPFDVLSILKKSQLIQARFSKISLRNRVSHVLDYIVFRASFEKRSSNEVTILFHSDQHFKSISTSCLVFKNVFDPSKGWNGIFRAQRSKCMLKVSRCGAFMFLLLMDYFGFSATLVRYQLWHAMWLDPRTHLKQYS